MINYNRDMTQIHKRLDRDKQRDLWVKIQNGDEEARNEVIYSCLPMVVDIAKNFRSNNRHVDLEDMVQEGNIALMCAVEKWDVERASITTVATWYVRNALIDMIHDSKYKIKNPSGALGVNMFRHSYVTYLYKVKKINEKQKYELANMMLHDQKTAESTYLYALAKNNQTIDNLAEENDELDVAEDL